MTRRRVAPRTRALLLTLMLLTGCGGSSNDVSPPSPPVIGSGEGLPTHVALCAGERHTCLIADDGHVLCAGDGLDGQLGSREHRTRRRFGAVPGIENATSLACADRHTCATTRDGSLHCWGKAASEQLGLDDAALGPVVVPGIVDAVQVVAGDAFTCVRSRSGDLHCLGALPEPERESAPSEQRPADEGEVVATDSTLRGVVDIAAGRAHVCALLSSGELRCRGDNRAGQLGIAPTHAEGWTTTAVRDAVDVDAGGALTCARIRGSGEIRCFGAGSQGQLGDGMRSAASFVPVTVSDVRGALALSVGASHACAIVGDTHALRCWGENTDDRLGSPGIEGHGPNPVRGLDGAVRVVTGGAHTCAITQRGELFCWGRAREGQLGIPVYEPVRIAQRIGSLAELRRAPEAEVPVARALTATLPGPASPAITTGADHLCALGADGVVLCWGGGEKGQLGHGRTSSSFERGVRVVGLAGVVAISSGPSHTCARLADTRVACWGEQEGGFGDGGADPSSLPVEVEAFRGARAIAAGGRMTCALMPDDTVRCSGAALFESHERLALRGTDRGLGVRTIRGLREPTALAVGDALGCAVVADGRVACWGPTPGHSTIDARLVRPLAGAVQLDVGHRTGCAASQGGRVTCWEAPLGSVAPLTGELVDGLTFVNRVVVGAGVRCANPRRGGYLCWGRNRSGETGTGLEAAEVRTPTLIADTAVTDQGRRVSLDCSDGFCCGVHHDGAVSCAGRGPLVHVSTRDAARPRTPLMIPLRVATSRETTAESGPEGRTTDASAGDDVGPRERAP